jgi:predicted transport protein
MTNEFKNLSIKPTGDNLMLCKGEYLSNNRFTALMLRKDGITIRIRVDPMKVIDPAKWVKEQKYDWFFYDGNGEEKEIKITSQDQLDYALGLIRQSYGLVK